MKIRVWLSYDLGIKGDYESLYSWLDKQKALECGDSIATFFWEDVENIKEDNNTGSFIVGKRKAAPWDGYSSEFTEDDD